MGHANTNFRAFHPWKESKDERNGDKGICMKQTDVTGTAWFDRGGRGGWHICGFQSVYLYTASWQQSW